MYEQFDLDPLLMDKFLQIKKSDYLNSGFDKGHQVQAEDMSWNEDAWFASFNMSNMTPQI